MEIGVLALFILISLGILFGEKTKVGSKFAKWGLKNLVGINIDEYPED